MSEIVFEHVSHRFGDRLVLDDIHLTLTERRIGIVGANGSGKSTLARTINGLIEPDRGRVLVDGLDVRRHGKQVRERVGFVFTDPDTQIVMPTVREDIAFTLRRTRLSAFRGRHPGAGDSSNGSGWPSMPTIRRTCSPAGRSNCSRSRRCWSASRPCSSPTSRPRCSTPAMPR